MTGRRERRRRRLQNQPPPQAQAPARAPRTVGERWRIPLVTVFVLALIGYCTAAVLAGDRMRDVIMAVPCRLSTCSGRWMAVGGWVLLAVPLAWTAAGIWRWSRLGAAGRLGWVLTGLVPAAVAYLFVPPGDVAALTGPGGSAFATGVRWGLTGLLTTVAVLVLVAIRRERRAVTGRPYRVVAGLAAVVCGVLSLVAAGVRAEARPVTAAAMFPGRFSAGGVRFVPVVTSDSAGCAGVLANEVLLRGCLRTAEVVATIDDGDTRVRLTMVLFASRSEARDRWADLPAGAGRQGDAGPAVSESDVAGGWLLLTTVRHADGRTITRADESRLRWDAHQAMVAAQRVQGDGGAVFTGNPTARPTRG